jgi:hypothetical protein
MWIKVGLKGGKFWQWVWICGDEGFITHKSDRRIFFKAFHFPLGKAKFNIVYSEKIYLPS